MNLRTLGFISILSLLFFQCKPDIDAKEMTVRQLAKEICQCSESLVTFNSELKELADKSNLEAMMAKIAEGDSKLTTSVFCVTKQLKSDVSALLTEELAELISAECQLDSRMTKDLIEKIASYKLPE